MSGVDVWGCTGNLAHTRYLAYRGGVNEMSYRIIVYYLKGYTVTGVTHGYDGHLQPREWVLGLSGMSLRAAVSSLNATPGSGHKNRAVLARISTGSRTRVPGSRLNGGNPPLVGPMGLVWHQSPPRISPCRSSLLAQRFWRRNHRERDSRDFNMWR